MANMSYVRFQNTLNDLLDCYHHMDQIDFDPEADPTEFPDGDMLSEEETEAKENLIELCQKIVLEYGSDSEDGDDEESEESEESKEE